MTQFVVTGNDAQRPTVLLIYRAIIPPRRTGATDPAVDAPQVQDTRTTTSLVVLTCHYTHTYIRWSRARPSCSARRTRCCVEVLVIVEV